MIGKLFSVTKGIIKKMGEHKVHATIVAIAVIAAILATMFPINIETGSPGNEVIKIGQGAYRITIGNLVSAQEADYTCDGNADDVTFQAALNALPDIGGQLFVLAGSYNWTESTSVTRAIDNVSVIGVGASAYIHGDGTTALFEAGGDKWLFSNIRTDAGGLEMSTTSDWMWLHIFVSTTYYPLRTDGINIEDHSALHGVGGADTVFPADPNADKYLKWDDDPGQLIWDDAGTGEGDMLKSTYDTDEDGDIDAAAGGTEWDSSGATGVAYITAGAWGTKSTGISNTYVVIIDDADAADDDFARFTANGIEGREPSEVRSDLSLVPGTDVQAYDAELAAIAGLTSAADKLIYFTGEGTADTSSLTAFGRSIVDDADEATFKATVNLQIGTDVQAWDDDVDDLAALTPTDSNIIVGDGSDWVAESGDTARTSLGLAIGTNVQAWDTDLDDIAALSDADSNFIVGDGANWVVESGDTVRASLGLIIGTNVQAYDAELAALAGLTSAADKVPYFTGDGTADVAGFTAYGRSMIAVVDEAGFKELVNLEIGTDVLAQQTIGIADDNLLEVDDAAAADDDFARFTANGIEGLTDAETLAALSGDASATFDWNGQTLADWGIEYGATLDASPTKGQLFLHTPTGRNILYQYDGSNWQPIMSLGAMTVYVDSSDGTDDLAHGTGVDSSAFATTQYAVNSIPGSLSGNVIVYMNAEAYSEDVVIGGKSFTGDYTISLIGTLSEDATGTMTGDGDHDADGTPDTFIDAGDLGGVADKLVYTDSDGDYRIIDSTDGDEATICGVFTSQALTGETYKIYSWGTVVDSITIRTGQKGIVLQNLDINFTGGGWASPFESSCRVSLSRCKFSLSSGGTVALDLAAVVTFQDSLTDNTRLFNTGGSLSFSRSKLESGTSNRILYLLGGKATVTAGTVIDGESAGNLDGIRCTASAYADCYSTAAASYVIIRNCDRGVRAETGGMVVSTSNNVYVNNAVVDESADGATYGYID